MTHKIGVIGGDGIGPEVVAEAIKVIDATGIDYERTDYDLGAHRYLEDGTVLPDEVMEEWRGLDALLLGVVGHVALGGADLAADQAALPVGRADPGGQQGDDHRRAANVQPGDQVHDANGALQFVGHRPSKEKQE